MKHVLFLAGMLIICAAHAGTDINKCVTPTGQVTLTDEHCAADAETIKVSNGAPDSDIVATPHKRTQMPVRAMAARRVYPPSSGLPRDVATMKAAHANSVLLSAR